MLLIEDDRNIRWLITAHGTTETAIEATRWGAFDYVVKPFEVEELLDLTAKALDSSRLMSEPVEMGDAASARIAIVGNSRVMQSIYREIGRVAATPVTFLIKAAQWLGVTRLKMREKLKEFGLHPKQESHTR